MFAEEVFHEVINLRNRIGNLPFSTMSTMFLSPWPIRPLNFCPREYLTIEPTCLPLHSLHIVVQSIHSSRVWMVVSAGPKSLSVFLSDFLLIPFSFLSLLCTVEQFHSVKVQKLQISVFYRQMHIFLSFAYPIFFARPVRGNFVPDVSTIVPPPLMLPSCVVTWVLFHHSRLC